MADISVSVGACGVLIALMMKRSRRNHRNRTVWVREWIRRRPNLGAYHQLVQELQLGDSATYRHFLRMDIPTFDEILRLVGPLITYQDTNMRQAISPGERLALTLHFLATGKQACTLMIILTLCHTCTLAGETYSSLQYLYRIPAQTIGQIVPETCRAIAEVLQQHLQVICHTPTYIVHDQHYIRLYSSLIEEVVLGVRQGVLHSLAGGLV